MADITKLSRLIAGINRGVDISANTLVTLSVKVGGGVSNTELTKAILDNLVALQDGSDFSSGTNAHTHDGRYFTESELGSTGATSGADLIGVNNTPSNYSAAAQTVQDHLEGIDAAIASAGGSDFTDSTFRISDNGDTSKKIAFEASGISASTVRTITMPDADVNLGQLANINLSNLGVTAVNLDILPESALTKNLGSASLPWATVHADNFRSTQRAVISFTGDTTSGSATIAVADTTGLLAGFMGVEGAGIPKGAYIVSLVANTSITLTVAATATASGVSFKGVHGASYRGGDKTGSDPSGPISYRSGNSVDGQSGAVYLRTGHTTGTGDSGDTLIATGNATNGDSGRISLFAGTASNGVRGNVELYGSSIILGGGENSGSIVAQMNILPDADDTRSIGAPSARFSNLYALNIDADSDQLILNGSSIGLSGKQIRNLADGTADDHAVNYGQLQDVLSVINNFEWQESAISIELDSDNIVAPSTGDRYLIAGTGLNDFATHDNQIAEWDGADWVFTSPSVGMYIAVDDESDGLYLYGGASWAKKYFEATTASTGLTKVGFDIRLADASANAISVSSGVLSVLVDDSTIEINSNALRVKAAGINENHLAASVAGNGLSGGAGSALAVNVDDSTIEINSDSLRVKDAGITAAKLNSNVADQDTITGGAGTALAVQKTPKVSKKLVAGESFAANTSFLVRWAVNGETAGRVYKADNDASSSALYMAVGIAHSSSAVSAGQDIEVSMLGSHDLGSSDSDFDSADIGKELFLGSSGAFILAADLTDAAGEAAYCIGVVEDVDKIWVDSKQLRGIA